jgi:hypothetical protein
VFTWTPESFQNAFTQAVTVVVTDDGLPPLQDAQTFWVRAIPRPVLISITRDADDIEIVWKAIPGQTYRLQHKTSLDDPAWSDVAGDVLAVGPVASKRHSPGPIAQRFYQVALLPPP